jgi:hypothetical protein
LQKHALGDEALQGLSKGDTVNVIRALIIKASKPSPLTQWPANGVNHQPIHHTPIMPYFAPFCQKIIHSPPLCLWIKPLAASHGTMPPHSRHSSESWNPATPCTPHRQQEYTP